MAMFRRLVFVVVTAVILAAVLGTASVAQSEGVRGTGAISVHQTNIGAFDIDVARMGNVLRGGFQYREYTPTGARPLHVIVSRLVTGLRVTGNTATIQAVGTWNGRVSDLMVEVLDDNPSGDWFRIVARPRSPLPVIYDASGGVIRGDISVWSIHPVLDGYTKGKGAIALPNSAGTIAGTVGAFGFYAEKSGDIVKGNLYYAEVSPTASAIVRPPVKIYLPAVQVLRLFFPVDPLHGRVAIMEGKGYLNGRPAFISARVVDNAWITTPTFVAVPDEFHIKATPITTTSVSNMTYEAGGRVLPGGEIVIEIYRPVD